MPCLRLAELVIVEPPHSPEHRKKNVTKERTKTKEKVNATAVPARPSFTRSLPLPPIPPKSQRHHAANPRVPQDKTTGVAHTSNMNRTARDRDLAHSHELSAPLHMTRTWPAHAGHLATRWNLDWCSPVAPASVGVSPVDLVPKIRPNRCVGGYKQVVPCGELFSCASQVRGRRPPPGGGLYRVLAADVVCGSLRRGARPGLGGMSRAGPPTGARCWWWCGWW